MSALRGAAILVLAGAAPAAASSQQRTSTPTSLVFDRVAVVDVEHGRLVSAQRVVIAGNRIQAVGAAGAVKTPKRAQVVDARGKYLVPGLWDMHVHPLDAIDLVYPLLLANGVTGIRDAGSQAPLDTLLRWRREVLAGTRLGPPRQLLSGTAIDEGVAFGGTDTEGCTRRTGVIHICVAEGDTADARHLVDSLKAAGADMIKMYGLSPSMYFTLAAAARRAGILFGGHINRGVGVADASDSGLTIVDHLGGFIRTGELDALCLEQTASVASCRPMAERFRRNGTWWVPTMIIKLMEQPWPRSPLTLDYLKKHVRAFRAGSPEPGNWLREPDHTEPPRAPGADSLPEVRGQLSIAQRVNLPLLVGTDAVLEGSGPWSIPPGFALHAELAIYGSEGLSPLEALRAATLNPAKMLHATDSLGTVAAGKLADLVLLDENPLADITNTTTIRAVVANGRYYDRAALDSLLVEVQAKAKQNP